jgi:hypothetical protein
LAVYIFEKQKTMRLAFATCASILLSPRVVTAVVVQDFFETVNLIPCFDYQSLIRRQFEQPNPNETCGAVPSCPDNLPGPVNALTWTNLSPVFVQGFAGAPEPFGQQAYDGVFYAALQNATMPAVLSARYGMSCVAEWKLDSFAAGCGARQALLNPNNGQTLNLDLGANCSIQVKGFDRRHRLIASETFFYNPGPLQFTGQGFPKWPMALFNTTRKGLRGKPVQQVRFNTTSVPGESKYQGDFHVGMDAVSYTVLNQTRC